MQMDFYLKQVSPLIIFGRPRAGTRFITNVLSSFPEVTLQGEIPDPVMDAMEAFIERVEKYYRERSEKKKDVGERQFGLWKDKKAALMYAFWAGVSQAGRAQPGNNCRYFGYKRPEHEKYFEFYERHFKQQKPTYIFCVRNFVDNYLSIKSRWPARKIAQVAAQYLSSVERYWKAVESAEGRVLLFNLDDHIRHGFEYTETAIIKPLKLEPSDQLRSKLAGMGATNRTQEDHGRTRRTSLNAREQAFVDSRPELADRFRELCVAG